MSKNIFISKLKRNKPATPRTYFEKNYLYGYRFKKDFKNKSREGKIIELLRLAKIKLTNKASYAKRRQKKHCSKKQCFVCNINVARYQHHIILLINGGFDFMLNRIPICDECHLEIHPWMINEREKGFNEEFKQKLELAYT